MNQVNDPPPLVERAMNAAQWTIQVLWGVFFNINGFGKYRIFLCSTGVFEFLGGVGRIPPAMTGVKPRLTSFAAFGLTRVMILADVFHIVRGEYHFLPINRMLGGVAAFIPYGRFVMPMAPASIGACRVLKGPAVPGVLALVDYASLWYTLTPAH